MGNQLVTGCIRDTCDICGEHKCDMPQAFSWSAPLDTMAQVQQRRVHKKNTVHDLSQRPWSKRNVGVDDATVQLQSPLSHT